MRRLLENAVDQGEDPSRDERLRELQVELNTLLGLLRQRKAHKEFDFDPDEASPRDAGVVENYEQWSVA
jgi:hypothetical protein